VHFAADLMVGSGMLALLWIGAELRGNFTRLGRVMLFVLWTLLGVLLYSLHERASDSFDQEQRQALPAVHAAAPTFTNRSRSAGPVA